MSDDRPMDIMLGHAEDNDGIEEYDNPMPGWLKWVFYLTIATAVIIFFDWHVINPKSQVALYEAERAAAIERYGEFQPLYVAFDAERASRGQTPYATFCAACHGADGSGLSGPSFLDGTWVYGSTIDDINRIVFFGVDGRGMPAWGTSLGPEVVADIASYVYQLSQQPGN